MLLDKNFIEMVIFSFFVSIIVFQLFILCYFNDSFYTLHSMILFSLFLHELLLNNLNWASEASLTLGCSIEILRDICCRYVVCRMSYVCRMSN